MQIGATARRGHTQARGRARRQALLEAARLLLSELPLDQISLPMVAERAEIPPSSTYHFYPDLKELFKDVARAVSVEMLERGPLLGRPAHWEDLVQHTLVTYGKFFNADGAARQLMLGSQTPPAIKHAACKEDGRFGEALRALINEHFVLPETLDSAPAFFRAIQIADVMFSLSVADHDRITEEFLDEAVNATNAYLGLYLPKILPRRAPRASPILVASR